MLLGSLEHMQPHPVIAWLIEQQKQIIELHDMVQTTRKLVEQILEVAMGGNRTRYFQQSFVLLVADVRHGFTLTCNLNKLGRSNCAYSCC